MQLLSCFKMHRYIVQTTSSKAVSCNCRLTKNSQIPNSDKVINIKWVVPSQ